MARWPYRVVFWSRASPDGKPGVIPRSSLEAAQVEAQAIARDGGTAEVRYVAESGEQRIVATYRPARAEPVPLADRARTVLGTPRGRTACVLVAAAVAAGVGVWARRGRRRPGGG
ncbi:MAG TPA: hypothetical protein VGH99_23165 [Pseudonocardia sp.]